MSSVESATLTGARAVDGDPSSRWASAERHDPEWITVDLGEPLSITRVVLTWEVAFARAYRVEISNDASTWRTLYSTNTGDGNKDELAVAGTGQYVRMFG